MSLSGKNKKNIVIIGGGISGLALLHYLKIKHYFRDDIEISLLEKSDCVGGTICSIKKDGCLFENGPNGFLDSKPQTFEFIKELGLESSIIQADESAKLRYISLNNILHQLPTNPKNFLSFKPLNIFQKLRVLGEIFAPRGENVRETVYDFAKRRLGKRFAEIFLDPMVSGIYGGDAKQIILKAAFPRIYQMEQEHGSLFRAMIQLKKQKKNEKVDGAPKGAMTSFKGGMSEVIDALESRYRTRIHCHQKIRTISKHGNQYCVYSENKQYIADQVFLCTPAYVAASLIKGINVSLADNLNKINYAPMAVVGFLFSKKAFKVLPKGFGYLIPSLEKKEVLGVLLDSNIYPNRASADQIFLRVMIGGIRHPDIIQKTKADLIQMAIDEVNQSFPMTQQPTQTFFKAWKQAIPQYDKNYFDVQQEMESILKQSPHLHILSNYYNGISFNDCIENAYQVVQKEMI